MTGVVHFSAEDRVARVTLSHPGKFNAMSCQMWRALRLVFLEIAKRPDLRCVLLRGADGHFCAGGDISEYPKFRFEEASLREFHESDVWGALAAMQACEVPLVAAIEGYCMGAGVEMASCCDIRVAGQGARFGAPIARLGFPMAPREAQLVARAVGDMTAREMLFEAAVLDAAEMKARGFLACVVPDGGVLDEAVARAQRIATLAPQAARANKRTLNALDRDRVEVGLLLGDAYVYADSVEHRHGIESFLGKKPPCFT
jgi:enoyl-CoA hydratase/carnithine racemase